MNDEQYRLLMAHLLHIEYQNRLIIWALGGGKPSQKPMPPAGVVVTHSPGSPPESAADPEGLAR